MKFAACLGVKDEIELIRPAIAHLRAIGVTHIIASDARSSDGTEQVLAALQGPDFDVVPFEETSTDPGYEAQATAEITARAAEMGADWLLFVDADEFPLPMSGQLADVAGLAAADAVIVHRHNVPLLPQGPAIGLPPAAQSLADILLYAPDMTRAETQSLVRHDPDAAWIGVVPAPKVMIRPDRVPTTSEGHHNIADAPGQIRLAPTDLIIAHVPFSTEARFARKIANIRAAIVANGQNWPPDSAWHWRRWLAGMDQGGGAAGEVARNRVTLAALAELRQAGVVKSVDQLMAQLRVQAAR